MKIKKWPFSPIIFLCIAIIFSFTIQASHVFAVDHTANKKKIAEYEKLAKASEKKGNKAEQALYLNKIGLLLLKIEKPTDAIKYFNMSIAIYKKLNKKIEVINGRINIANTFKVQGYYDKAIKEYDVALVQANEIKHVASINICYKGLIENFKLLEKLRQKEDVEKKTEIDKLKDYAQLADNEINLKIEALQAIENTLDSTERTLAEVVALNRAKEMEIALLNSEKEIREITLKEQKASILNKELIVLEQKARIENEELIRNSVLAGLFLSGVILLVLYRGNRIKSKTNLLIKAQSDKILDQNLKIKGSINYAQRIQEAMLPKDEEVKKLFPDSFILFKPREGVSGDFYWYAKTNKNVMVHKYHFEDHEEHEESDRLIITAVDCTGHGVPGAFMSMIGYNLLNSIVSRGIVEADQILNELHKGIRSSLKQYKTDNKDGMDLALCVIHQNSREVDYAGAKNPLIYIQDGELVELKADKFPIGGYQKEVSREFTKKTIKVDKPTTFYLFSDGYLDQFGGPDNKKFMSRRFKDQLLKIHHLPMDEQKLILDHTIETWKGENSQLDDILVIGFKI